MLFQRFDKNKGISETTENLKKESSLPFKIALSDAAKILGISCEDIHCLAFWKIPAIVEPSGECFIPFPALRSFEQLRTAETDSIDEYMFKAYWEYFIQENGVSPEEWLEDSDKRMKDENITLYAETLLAKKLEIVY